MSRAFVKEDVDPPERSGRVRAASGLPPGATNYMTAPGAQMLRCRLEQAHDDEAIAAELRRVLDSATVVEPPKDANQIAFGARVTVRSAAGKERRFHIVGIDELDLFPDAVSWISPIGKTLLASEPGDRITLDEGEGGKIVKVEYPRGS
jgi:transcription elongation factor GreB